MKEKLLNFLNDFINYLQKIYNHFSETSLENLPYTSLSAIDNADIESDYKKSLDWALKNRKNNDIKNIAITGPYGSGKTSILKTYMAKYGGKNLHFLNISLATFKEEESNGEKNIKEDLLRLIELSILQQIFYHEKDSKIPDSRFRKIKNYKKTHLIITTLSLFFLILSVINLVYPNLLELLLKVDFNSVLNNFLHFSSLFIIIISILHLTYKSIRIISSVKIDKLNIQNAEISIDESISKSILNNHIDEILYFFEVTEYNIVIIEDLDRFKQTEIFTKLREINLLINNSKKIKKDVVFIYAVRDDIFKEDNERTKFFDFIIPVIPIINPSNSGQKLIEQKQKNNYNISENLIDSVSLFIDDMRLLYNIMNEYYLYQQKLNNTLNQDKLLSIIVYKNIFPNDFTLLNNNKGLLFDCIDNKRNYVQSEILQINNKINNIRKEIKELEALKIKDIKELRNLYLLAELMHLKGFAFFSINGEEKTIAEMSTDTNFDYLLNDAVSYHIINNSYARSIPKKFEEIEKQVDPSAKYAQRILQIKNWNDDRIEILKKEIQELEKNKEGARNLKIRQLLSSGNIEINIENAKQKKITNILLLNGFIDEDYLDYVSIFYEGSLTKIDYQFLLNVKSQTPTRLDYKLNNINKLIEKINIFDFDKEYTLNYSLLDFVFCNQQFKEVKNTIFIKLKDESDISVEFINGFIDTTTNIKSFIIELVSAWTNIWIFLKTKSSFTEEQESKYFKLIIEYARIEDLVILYKDNFFKSKILENPNFLIVTNDIQRIKEIIKSLNLHFVLLNSEAMPTELLDFIYENDYYEINPTMLALILKAKGDFNQSDFDKKNYWSIENSKCEHLKKYINKNLNEYITNVYLKIKSNNKEEEKNLIALLNSDSIIQENKEDIIKLTQTKISDLSLTESLEVDACLFEQSKVKATWENVFLYYQTDENKISEPIITFLNNKENAQELSVIKIKKDVEGKAEYTSFISKIITTNSITDENYSLILKSVPYKFASLEFGNLSKSKHGSLLQNGILVFNTENYDLLKLQDFHIMFIEYHKPDFLNQIKDYEINATDASRVLESTKFNFEEKNRLVESLDETILISSDTLLRKIGLIILDNNSFRIANTILKVIIVNKIFTTEEKIRVFNLKHNQLENEYLDSFLNSLGEPYSDIAIRGKRPALKRTEYNHQLAEILESKRYISSFFANDDKGIRISTFSR